MKRQAAERRRQASGDGSYVINDGCKFRLFAAKRRPSRSHPAIALWN